MTHRAESIVVAVLAKVTSLTTTGARVFRGRVRPLQDSEVPALFLYLGADEIQQELSQALVDSLLTLHLDAVVRSATDQTDTLLNTIRAEVTVALRADYTQGLSYVIDTHERGSDEPNLSGDGEQRFGSMRLTWQFQYRRSRANPGA